MSLLLDALDRAERARREQRSLSHPELSLEPREGEESAVPGVAGSAADAATLFQLDDTPSRPWAQRAGKLLPWLIVLLLLGAGGAWWWFMAQLPPTGLPGLAVTPAPAPAPAPTAPANVAAVPAAPAPAAVAAPSLRTGTGDAGSTGHTANTTAHAAHPAAGSAATAIVPPLTSAPAAGAAHHAAAGATGEDRDGSATPGHSSGAHSDGIRAAPGVDVRLFRSATPAEVDPQLVAAWTALRDGKLEVAAQAYARLEQQQPGNPDVQLGLGRLAAEQGRGEAARRYYRRALDLDPHNAAAAAGLAVLEPAGNGGDIDSQLRAQAAGSDGDAQFALGARLSAAGQWPEAEQAWFEALRGHPGDPDVLCNLAVSLDHLGQTSAARQYYREALQAAANRPAHFSRPQVEQRLQALGAN